MQFGVIMDLDGTLIDSPLNFAMIRQDLGLPEGAPILEAIAARPAAEREFLEKKLLGHEWAAARDSRIFPGVAQFFSLLEERGIKRAIFTRNSGEIAEYVLGKFGIRADLVVGREHAPPKPDPAGLHVIRERWGSPREHLLFLGDYLYDLEAGKRAGITTWLFAPGDLPAFADRAARVYRTYAELESLDLFTEAK